MLKSRLVFVLLTMLVAFSVQSAFSMIRTLPLHDLVQQSEVIAIAMVEKISDQGMDKDGISNVKNVLLLSKLLKGTWDVKEPIVVMTKQAGKPGKIGWLEDQIQFPPKGKQVILFLKKAPDGSLQTVNLLQGVWPLDGEKPLGMGFGFTMDQLKQEIEKK
ncbi:MAG: hypothetical protein HQM08_07465 [Candidatus Riflebacteria bacterium]|nr:hypothetical protein [Candidatus Riflebacteria bacterium]